MGNLTNAFEKELTDGLTGVTQLTTPGTVYLALLIADPTETGSVTNEVTGTGYARASLAAKFSASTDGSSANTASITFPTAGAGGWGTITHIGFMKSGTAGADDMMAYKALVDPITIDAGEVFEFSIGNLDMTSD